jgi:hypothetical protein
MFGDVLARHGKEQVSHMGGEEPRITLVFSGEREVNLLLGLTVMAMNAGNIKDDGRFFASDGNGSKGAFFMTLSPNIRRPANGAGKFVTCDGELIPPGTIFCLTNL